MKRRYLLIFFLVLGLAQGVGSSFLPNAELKSLEKKVEQAKFRIESLVAEYQRIEGRYIDLPAHAEGRLTTESGVALSTTDRTSQSTIYYTPYLGSIISLYDGVSLWTQYQFTEKSLALSGLTSGANYDVFAYSNSGTVTLELSTVWTDDVTRADALTLQNGIYLKASDLTRRYLGTLRTTSTTTTEDSKAKRFLWNYQNRLPRMVSVVEAANSWSYTTTSWRGFNNSTANRFQFVIGMADTLVTLTAQGYYSNGPASIGIGYDSTTVNNARVFGSNASAGNTNVTAAVYSHYPPIGFHYLQMLEYGNTGVTFIGDNNGIWMQSGIVGMIDG